jgi:hypothetical protein
VGACILLGALSVTGCADLLGLDDFEFEPPAAIAGQGGVSGSGATHGSAAAAASDQGGEGGDGESGSGGSSGGAAGPACAEDAVSELSCDVAPECSQRACGGYLWDGGLVPFEIDAEVPDTLAAQLESSAAAWSDSSEAVEFERCPDDDCEAAGHTRWLQVSHGPATTLEPSTVTGEQALVLRDAESSERVTHELGHVLGLPDVWRRPDRDHYLSLSEAAFCDAQGHWDAVPCAVGEEEQRQPQRRTTGQFGPFDAGSAMNLAGPEVCEANEPSSERAIPTAADGSALTELYRTAEGWSPFLPLADDGDPLAPLDHSLPMGTIASAPALSSLDYPALEAWVLGSEGDLFVKRFQGSPVKATTLGPPAGTRYGSWSEWALFDCCFSGRPAALSWRASGSGPTRTDVFAISDGQLVWADAADGTTPNFESLGAPDVGIAEGAGPVATTWGAGRADVFLRGADGFLYQTFFSSANDAWSDWTKLGDKTFAGDPAAAAVSEGHLDVVVASSSGALHHLAYQDDWSATYTLLDGGAAPGSSPALAATVSGVHLFVQSPERGQLSERTLVQGVWGAWRDLGGIVSGSPAALGSSFVEHVDVAALVPDNGQDGLYLRASAVPRPCYVEAATCAECAEACDGACSAAPVIAGDPAHYSLLGNDYLVARAKDGRLQRFEDAAATWQRLDLSVAAPHAAQAESDPRVYLRTDGYVSVVYRAPDDRVFELLNSAAEWSVVNLSDAGQAPDAVGEIFPFTSATGRESVTYLGRLGQIYRLTFGTDAWVLTTPMNLAGAPAAAGDPRLFNRSNGIDAYIYRGTDGHLHEIYIDSTAVHYDLFAGLVLEPVAGEGFPYVRPDDLDAVVYRAANGHVYQLSTTAGSHSWTASDLTQAAGAPSAAGDPIAHLRSDGLLAIVYRGPGGDLHELAEDEGTFTWTNLSDVALAPAAAGEPVAYTKVDGVSAIAFRSADDGLCELVLEAGTWEARTVYTPP